MEDGALDADGLFDEIDEPGVRGEVHPGRDRPDDLALELHGVPGAHRELDDRALLDARGGLPGERLLHVRLAEHAVPDLVGVAAADHLAVLVGDREHVHEPALHELPRGFLDVGRVPALDRLGHVRARGELGGAVPAAFLVGVQLVLHGGAVLIHVLLGLRVKAAR